MKIIVAPDSFKGSLSAVAVAEHLSRGIRRVVPEAEIIPLPVADGGEGTCEALTVALGGEKVSLTVTGPNGDPVPAEYGRVGELAIVEMASASGLDLVPTGELRPLEATTYGTGELLRHALDNGATKLLLGIGGSATTDGGVGMAQALGVRFLDAQGQELAWGGGALGQLAQIDVSGLDPKVLAAEWIVASDVQNPLYGEQGSAYVYGPQKGCTPDEVLLLDGNLRHYAQIIGETLGMWVADIPGAGAAGGLGAGLMAFCQAKLQSGVDTVLDAVEFDAKVQTADLVITGEGWIDYQSAYGKLPIGVAKRTKKVNAIPVIALAGGIGEGAEQLYAHGLDAIIAIADQPMSLEQSMQQAPRLLADTAERVMRILLTGAHLKQDE